MTRKEKVLKALTVGQSLTEEFMHSLDASQRTTPGDFLRWSAKDQFTHNRAWIDTTIERMQARLRGQPGPSYPDENKRNQQIYKDNVSVSFDAAYSALKASLKHLYDETARMSDDALESSDSGPAPMWRGIINNGLTHLILHLATYWIEQGQPERGMALYQRAADAAITIDDSPEWRGEHIYNHACMLAINGRRAEALPLLREALAANPSLLEWSKQDSDLVSLHGDPDYEALYTEAGKTAQ